MVSGTSYYQGVQAQNWCRSLVQNNVGLYFKQYAHFGYLFRKLLDSFIIKDLSTFPKVALVQNA